MTSGEAAAGSTRDARMRRGARPARVAVALALGLTFLVMGVRGPAGATASDERAVPMTNGQPTGTTTPATPAIAGASAATAEQLARGQELYLTGCVSCHGINGVGNPDVPAPALTASGAASADFYLRTGRMPLSEPVPQPPDKPPAYSDRDIQALVAYVGGLCDTRNFGCPAIPNVQPQAGDLQEGGALFLANCAPCHNSVAIGGALSRGRHAPSLQQTQPLQIGEAMRTGPGEMPQFGPELLSDEQVNSIVSYVEYLHRPEHPGGVSLGYTGPVAEGFVALLLGLGALVLAIRWITREPTESGASTHGGPV